MSDAVQKVTAFITRRTLRDGGELLLLEHPHAGIQLPSGTVDQGETPEAAVVRESREETGLRVFVQVEHLHRERSELPEGNAIIGSHAEVFLRPRADGASWGVIPAGISVRVDRVDRVDGSFTQVTYTEPDRLSDPQYTTYSVTGWVRGDVLATAIDRDFFELHHGADTPTEWTHFADHLDFRLFWVPWDQVPPLVAGQDEWMKYLRR